jgi:REP element-mobilizing transposase RayT
MARPLRLEFAGAVYHITARGNLKQAVFVREGDYRAFLSILNDVQEGRGWLIYAYCLMANHYHLLLETPGANLSAGMHYLNGVYAQAFNRRHGSVGHVFQGRFKSILVDKESHALELSRYIPLNPVRAGIVRHPAQWKWSSFNATAGLAPRPRFLSTDWTLEQFSSSPSRSRKAFERFVLDGVGADSPWKDLRGGLILGGDKFAKRVSQRAKAKKRTGGVPRKERFANRPSLEKVFAGRRRRPICAEAAVDASRNHGYTLREVAGFLEVTPSAVTRAIQRSEQGGQARE